MTDQEKSEAAYILMHARIFLQNAEGLDMLFSRKMRKPHGRYIVFCRNTEHLKQMKEESRKWFDWVGEIHYYTVLSSNRDSQREIWRFERDKADCLRLLFAIDMLNEGVHIPSIDGIIMLRPTKSVIVYLQQLGRALSVDTEDRVQIFDIVNNAKELEQGKKFWNGVIRSMQAKGIYYEDAFDVFSRDVEFDSLIMNLDKFLEELGVSWSVKRDEETGATARWMEWYVLCEQFVREHGDFRIPGTYVLPDGTRLGKWVKRTRNEKYKLNEKQIELLDRIGMVWDVRTPKGGGKDEI